MRLTRGSVVLLGVLLPSLAAAALSRNTLWRVEQTCILDKQTTGSPFPCLDVDLADTIERGHAVLRAPFRETHIVVMPTVRTSGVEAPELALPNAPNYLKTAWEARRFVQAEVERPLARSDVGLAINSRVTRSQDQLHIHVDCVRRDVKRTLAGRFAQAPTDAWQPAGFVFQHQSYWLRRVDRPTLDGINLFEMAGQIPALRADPGLAILAVVGATATSGADGFLLLAGRSEPGRGGAQSTSEDLLDHGCAVAKP